MSSVVVGIFSGVAVGIWFALFVIMAQQIRIAGTLARIANALEQRE